MSRVCVCACVRGATRAETPWHSANWRHHATPPELFNYFGGGVGWQPWSAGRRDHAYTPLSPWNRESRLTRNRDFHEGGKKKEESNGKWKYCSVSSDPDPQRGPFSLRKVEFERLIYTVFQDPLDDLCPITRNEINNCTILREKGRIINKNSRRSFILDDC